MIYSTRTHAEPPFEAQAFTLAQQPDFMMSLGVSEYTLNSASYAYYSAGLLQILINESMVRGVRKHAEYVGWPRLTGAMSPTQIPLYSPVHLNTSSVGAFIPQVRLVSTGHANAFISERIWILTSMINHHSTRNHTLPLGLGSGLITGNYNYWTHVWNVKLLWCGLLCKKRKLIQNGQTAAF